MFRCGVAFFANLLNFGFGEGTTVDANIVNNAICPSFILTGSGPVIYEMIRAATQISEMRLQKNGLRHPDALG